MSITTHRSFMKIMNTVIASVLILGVLLSAPQAFSVTEPNQNNTPESTKLFSSLSSLSSSSSNIDLSTPPHIIAPVPPKTDSGNSTITVNQGDRIVIDGIHTCTVGYIDKVKGVAYTAQHCGGYTFKEGKPVSVLHNGWRTTIGNFVYPHDYLKHIQFPPKPKYDTQFNNPTGYYIDIAAIKLNSNARLGSNTYSNDTYTKYEDITVGQPACFYGITTNNAKCGKVTKKFPDTRHFFVQLNDNSEPLPGDSGGPIYAPNKGNSLGILSGITKYDNGANYIDVTGL